MHSSTLSSCVIFHTVLGMREAAAAGRWFCEKPILDYANLGAASETVLPVEAEVDAALGGPNGDTVEYWMYQWFGLR